ncbi:MAG: fatty acyl-AMP ligase [Acidimicrobiales bacterium]|nr:fatty acyl-AMP ligase [Hyphomonadaceae bacterium]RZV43727.1 MAG: fatty acyl-AMP ligase [Acidimicrobiales bacterium]
MNSPTPTTRIQPYIPGKFETLIDGLEYAAQGNSGFNFFTGKGELKSVLTFTELRDQAVEMAHRLVGITDKGDRIGICAVTSPDFAIMFFACQYAGLIPAPLPLPVTLGGRGSYERQLQRMADTGDFSALLTPKSMENIMSSALNDHDVPVISFEDVKLLPKQDFLRPHDADGPCYIQYSSGSSSSPKGVIGTQASVTANCFGQIGVGGLQITENDRCTSWLPLYHDMGLVGFMITPVMSQMSVDYLDPQDFTRRPLTWLQLISDYGGTLSFSPTFGFELCVRRWREDRVIDLSSWRGAGIGGDMVQPEPLKAFVDTFGKFGFEIESFVPSYGLAEVTLAATFSPPRQGLLEDTVDMEKLERTGEAAPANDLTAEENKRTFIACGKIIPDHVLEIRSMEGEVLGQRQVGRICIKGPSVTPGYFHNALATQAAFTEDGFLDTGDLGYWLDDQVVVTGRFKDLILWHGRNIWPQDIEWAAQAAATSRCGRACSFAVGGSGDEKEIILLLECRTRDQKLLSEIHAVVSGAIRLEIGAPVTLILVPRGSMIVTSSGKLSRARVREKFLNGAIINLQEDEHIKVVDSAKKA